MRPARGRSRPIAASSTAHPLGFWFFFWGEFAERCSYYGMRAILLLYMIERLGLQRCRRPASCMSCFMAACYLLPLVGGYVADNYFGKYRTIVFFSLPYIIGQVILGIENVPFLVIALSLVGDGQRRDQAEHFHADGPDLRPAAARPDQAPQRRLRHLLRRDQHRRGDFLVRHALAPRSLGLPDRLLVPGGLMAVALLIFAAGKPFYADETIRRVALARGTPATAAWFCDASSGCSSWWRSSGAFSTSRPAPGPCSPATISS